MSRSSAVLGYGPSSKVSAMFFLLLWQEYITSEAAAGYAPQVHIVMTNATAAVIIFFVSFIVATVLSRQLVKRTESESHLAPFCDKLGQYFRVGF